MLMKTGAPKGSSFNHGLGCRKWGFKRWGCKEIRGYLRKKAFFLRFLDFPGALQALRKRGKKDEKGRFRPISGKGGQTPLKPPFVTPPFAAAQTGWFSTFHLVVFRIVFLNTGICSIVKVVFKILWFPWFSWFAM